MVQPSRDILSKAGPSLIGWRRPTYLHTYMYIWQPENHFNHTKNTAKHPNSWFQPVNYGNLLWSNKWQNQQDEGYMESNHFKASCWWQRLVWRWCWLIIRLNDEAWTSVSVILHLLILYLRAMLLLFSVGFFLHWLIPCIVLLVLTLCEHKIYSVFDVFQGIVWWN